VLNNKRVFGLKPTVFVSLLLFFIIACGSNMINDSKGSYKLDKDKLSNNSYIITFKKVRKEFKFNKELFLKRTTSACPNKDIVITGLSEGIKKNEFMMPIVGLNIFIPQKSSVKEFIGSFMCSPTQLQIDEFISWNRLTIESCNELAISENNVQTKQYCEELENEIRSLNPSLEF